MPQNLSAQNVCPSPKAWDFDEKRLHCSYVVCVSTHKFLSTQCIFNGRLAACTTQFKAQIREKVLHFTEILDLLNIIIEMKSRRTFFSDVFVYIIISMHTAQPLFRLLHCKTRLHFWHLEQVLCSYNCNCTMSHI